MALTRLEDLSPVSQAVLFTIAGSIVGALLTLIFAFFRAVRKVLWKQRKPQKGSRHKVADSATSAHAHEPSKQPQRHASVPYKQLVQQSKASKNKKQDEGKIVDHPLYIFSLKDHREGVNGFDWALDGSAVVSACEDRCVRLFNFSGTIDKGIVTRQINIQDIPTDVGFLQDTSNIVVLCKGFLDTASLKFYSNRPSELGGTQWTCTKTVIIFNRPLRLETVLHPDSGRMLVIACSAAKEAKIYDTTGGLLASFAPNSFVNHDLAVSYNAQLASIATFTADAKVWELRFSRDGVFRSSPKVMDLKGHKSKVMTVAFSMDATKAVSVSQDGIMKIWNVNVEYNQQEDPRCLLSVKLSLEDEEYYHRLAFGPDDALAAAINDSIHFIDIEDGGVIDKIENAHDGLITFLSWAPVERKCRKGKLRVLASSSRDRRVRLWAHPEDI